MPKKKKVTNWENHEVWAAVQLQTLSAQQLLAKASGLALKAKPIPSI